MRRGRAATEGEYRLPWLTLGWRPALAVPTVLFFWAVGSPIVSFAAPGMTAPFTLGSIIPACSCSVRASGTAPVLTTDGNANEVRHWRAEGSIASVIADGAYYSKPVYRGPPFGNIIAARRGHPAAYVGGAEVGRSRTDRHLVERDISGTGVSSVMAI
jgi:hypothetical protein